MNRRRFWDTLGNFLFVAPYLCFFVLFLLIPVIRSVYISFFQWGIFSPVRPFVGLENYIDLMQDELFWIGLRNTSYFALLTVVLNVLVSFGTALAVKNRLYGLSLYRTIFYAPVIISVSAMAIIWGWLLNTEFGVVNYILGFVGFRKISWIGSPGLVIPSLSVATVWWTFGFPMMIFLAALQDIPETLYEAAVIDGANPIGKLTRITLPLLRPVFLLICVTQVASQLQIFGQPYIMTEGGPGYSSFTLVMYLYQTAWRFLRMGYGSALAVVLALIILFFAAVQFRFLGQRVEY